MNKFLRFLVAFTTIAVVFTTLAFAGMTLYSLYVDYAKSKVCFVECPLHRAELR
jgi:hypothetical protein